VGFFSDFLSRFSASNDHDLRSRLSLTKKVRISGVLFDIKKIDMLDYLEGAKVLHEVFSTYKTNAQKALDDKMIVNVKKARDYLKDVILAGVVKPQIVRRQEDNPDAITIDELLNDWMLAQELAGAILAFTYGKKK
jgi:hypothetical protein